MDLFLYDRDLRPERIIWSLNDFKYLRYSETYLGLCQISMMKFLAKIVNSFYPLTIFIKSSITDILQDPKYTSDTTLELKSHY